MVQALPGLPLAVGKGQALEVDAEVGAEGLQGVVTIPAQGYLMGAGPNGPIQLLLVGQVFEGAVQLHLSHGLAHSATVQVEHLHLAVLPKAVSLGQREVLAHWHTGLQCSQLRIRGGRPGRIRTGLDEILARHLQTHPAFHWPLSPQQAVPQAFALALQLSHHAACCQTLRELRRFQSLALANQDASFLTTTHHLPEGHGSGTCRERALKYQMVSMLACLRGSLKWSAGLPELWYGTMPSNPSRVQSKVTNARHAIQRLKSRHKGRRHVNEYASKRRYQILPHLQLSNCPRSIEGPTPS